LPKAVMPSLNAERRGVNEGPAGGRDVPVSMDGDCRYLDLEISHGPEAQGGDLIFRIER
jgi:hypothetical protein